MNGMHAIGGGLKYAYARILLGVFLSIALNGCGPTGDGGKPPAPQPDRIVLKPADFRTLPGWDRDPLAAALAPLQQSCSLLRNRPDTDLVGSGATVADWRAPCRTLATVQSGDDAAARAFFERFFTVMQVTNHGETTGLFTGYYEADLKGSKRPDARFSIPLYRRPPDLVSVDLGQFRPSLKGERVAGRVSGGKLVPYATRSDIEAGALGGKGLELVWVDSAVDAFFLAIQGSGRVTLPDGQVMRVGYDGENGHPYVAIGRVLAEAGTPRDIITMPYLRRYIADHGAEGVALMDKNPSYIFFKELTGPGPLGSAGLPLTPDRSAAVDRTFIPFGTPLFVDTSDPTSPTGRLQRLVIAQDTGGAIRGPVRADLFFGYGPEAADHAGVLKGQGNAYILVPKP